MSDWTNYNGVNVPTVDPPLDDAGYYLKYNFITLADSTLTADGTTIVNNSGVLSAEQLTDGTALSVNGVNRVGKATDGSTTTMGWSAGLSGYAADGSSSLDCDSRYLRDSGGVSVDYGNHGLRVESGIFTTVDWGNQKLLDTTPTVALNWATRQLIGSDGTTPYADWNGGLRGFQATHVVIDGVNLNLADINGVLSIDWTNRQLEGPTAGIGAEWDDTGFLPSGVGNSLVVVSDGSGHLTTSGINTTPTELNYVHGVTSAIQTQLDGKIGGSIDGTTIVSNSGVLSAEKLTDGTHIAVDGVNRVGKASGGTTTTMDWSAGFKGYDPNGNLFIQPSTDSSSNPNFQLIDPNSNHVVIERRRDGSAYPSLNFSAPDTGAEQMTVNAYGVNFDNGITGSGNFHLSLNPTSRQLIGGDGTTVAASWNSGGIVPANLSSNPSSPAAGQIYFNTTDSHFYGYNGSAWKQLDN